MDLLRPHPPTAASGAARPTWARREWRLDPLALGLLVVAAGALVAVPALIEGTAERVSIGLGVAALVALGVRQARRPVAPPPRVSDPDPPSRHRALLRGLRDVVLLVDSHGGVAWATPSAGELFEASPPELVGRRFDTLFHPEEAKSVRAFLRAVTRDGATAADRRAEWRLYRADRSARYVEAVVADLREDPLVRGVVVSLRDVTDRRRQREELERHAFHDALTGLANRSRFHDRLGHALERLRRQPVSVAVFFIDVDRFKEVNDTHGHAAGDTVLVAVAQRIERSIRSSDTAARIAGDEFAVLLEDLTDPLQADRVAERLLRSFRDPVPVGDRAVPVSVSVGVAVTSGVGLDAADLLRNADLAMYSAKQAGRGCWRSFDATVSSGELPRLVVPREAQPAPRPLSGAAGFRRPTERPGRQAC